jgi:hypothetical protein
MVHRQLVRGRNAAFLIAALTAATAAQGPAVPVADLERTVNRFFETAAQYEQTFRNLAVEETRLIEELDQSGRVMKRREIVADLVVYRTARNGDDVGPPSTGMQEWWTARRLRSAASRRST